MSTNFLSLPSELRNIIYEEVLVLEEPIECPSSNVRREQSLEALALGLPSVNKIIRREASSMFYARNCFDFALCTTEDVEIFLEQIGLINASYILHVRIDFPDFCDLDLHNVTLYPEGILILAKIQSGCANWSTLTTSLHSTNTMEEELDSLCNHKIVTEALALVNATFRAISSLQEIIVEVYEDAPSDYIRKEMKKYGWTFSPKECVEESDFERDWSDMDGDGDYDDEDDDGDEYDIDKDSDFWRRAAD